MRAAFILGLVAQVCLSLARADAPTDLKIRPVKGPTTVTLGDNLARLDVPAGYLFLNRDDAIHVLHRAGNPTDGSEIGLLHPATPESRAFIVIEHAPVGHVSDGDALDTGALLSSITTAQAAQNEARKARGQPEITVAGWAEPPLYDKIARRMTWAVKARAGKEELINARTRILGRTGYLSFNLITDPAAFAHDKTVLSGVLAGTAYAPGQRYEDFQPGRDRDSGKGLADLIVAGPGAPAEPGKLKNQALVAIQIVAGIGILCVLLFGRFRRRTVWTPESR